MWIFTEIAEWFEKQRRETDVILDQWVEDSEYNFSVMLIASTTKAFTTVGAGFVDIIRLGDGIEKGSWKGIGEDALRVVAIFPVGKAASLIRSAKGVVRAKLIVDIGGPNCFWVTSAKALSQTGYKIKGKLFASVDDVAKALGMEIGNLWKIPNLSTGMSYLKRLGAKVGPIIRVTNLTDIKKILPHDGSVVIIAVDFVLKNGKAAGHAIYAYRNAFGGVRFFDRTVGRQLGTKGIQGVFQTMDDIAPFYGAIKIIPREASVLSNVFLKSFAFESPRLTIPILGIMAKEEQQ